MKILFIASASRMGGASVALYNLIKGLKDQHEVVVLLPKSTGYMCDKLDELGVPYYCFQYYLSVHAPSSYNFKQKVVHYLKLIVFNNLAKFRLKSLLKKLKPDIVHNNVGPLDISFDVCKKMDIKHVWHQREYQDKDFGMTFFPSKAHYQKKILDPANRNIAITKGVFAHWNLRDCDRVIYDGVFDTNIPVKTAERVVEEPYFLFAGRLEEAKGVMTVIEAFNKFNETHVGYKLLIAGRKNGVYADKCISFVESHNLTNQVIFLGERSDVYQLMSNAVALVVPSRFEGFGFITAEAMYNRCLVIGKNTAGTKEQFDNGFEQTGHEIGLRFHTDDELVAQMEVAISKDCGSIKADAFNVVTRNYSTSQHAENVDLFYHSI